MAGFFGKIKNKVKKWFEPDVNAVDKNGNTKLHQAVWSGDVNQVKALLEKGADVFAKDGFDGATAFHKCKNPEIMSMLLDGAKKQGGLKLDKILDKNGCAPLQTMKDFESIKKFHESAKDQGIDLIKAPQFDPLCRANDRNDMKAATYFIEQGADISRVLPKEPEMVKLFVDNGRKFDSSEMYSYARTLNIAGVDAAMKNSSETIRQEDKNLGYVLSSVAKGVEDRKIREPGGDKMQKAIEISKMFMKAGYEGDAMSTEPKAQVILSSAKFELTEQKNAAIAKQKPVSPPTLNQVIANKLGNKRG